MTRQTPKAPSRRRADIKNVGKIARGNLHERSSFSIDARMANCRNTSLQKIWWVFPPIQENSRAWGERVALLQADRGGGNSLAP
jgi:hypothetical protein